MPLFDDPRSAWTDYVPQGRVHIAPSTRDGVTWHWAGPRVGLFGKSHAACLSQVRSWEAYHRSKGWNSIGYNALICPHNRVIEGRGFDYRGAHAGTRADNARQYGVQFMVGDLTPVDEQVTPAMFDRAYHLERALWSHSGRTLTSFGHRDFMDTACPGPQVYKWAHSTHTLSTTPPPAPTGGFTMSEYTEIMAAIKALSDKVDKIPAETTTKTIWYSPNGEGPKLWTLLTDTHAKAAQILAEVVQPDPPAAEG